MRVVTAGLPRPKTPELPVATAHIVIGIVVPYLASCAARVRHFVRSTGNVVVRRRVGLLLQADCNAVARAITDDRVVVDAKTNAVGPRAGRGPRIPVPVQVVGFPFAVSAKTLLKTKELCELDSIKIKELNVTPPSPCR